MYQSSDNCGRPQMSSGDSRGHTGTSPRYTAGRIARIIGINSKPQQYMYTVYEAQIVKVFVIVFVHKVRVVEAVHLPRYESQQ